MSVCGTGFIVKAFPGSASTHTPSAVASESQFNKIVRFHPSSSSLGAGILTCFASTTPYGLALAPD